MIENDVRLAAHLPQFMREVTTISRIMQTGSDEIDAVEAAVAKGLDNSFVMFADGSGLARWERLLGILPTVGASTESRRREVLLRLGDRLPYTHNTLHAALAALFGVNSIEIDGQNFTVTLWLDLSFEESFPAIERFIRGRVPANMRFVTLINFIRHGELSKFTHGTLAMYSHRDIMRRKSERIGEV
jgi:hypothetical protein